MKCKKGTYAIRQIWISQRSSTISVGRTKWDADFNNNQPERWKYWYTLADKCNMNVRTRFFHFQDIEPISHLLYECPNILTLWQELQAWLTTKLTCRIHFDKISILLGNTDNEPVINTLIMITKQEIFKSKCKATPLHLQHLKHIFKSQMQTELYLGTIKNQRAKALGKWSSIYN